MAKKLSDFERAFAAARAEKGKGGTFEYKGKSYSTNYAGESSGEGRKKQTAPKAKPEVKDDEPSVLPRNSVRPSADDDTTDRRENNRLRQANPVMWDAQQSVKKSPTPSAPSKVSNQYSDEEGYKSRTGLGNAGWKKGGTVKKYAAGGAVRGGGCEVRGRTKGKMR